MKRKANFLAENVVSIIIAILILTLFVIGIYSWYSSVIENQETESAQNLADLIEAKISSLKDGQNNNFTIRGVNSKESWYLAGWGKDEFPKPDKCFFDSCICVCKGLASVSQDQIINQCKDIGICRKIDKEKVVVNIFGREPEETFGVARYNPDNVIDLPNKLFLLEIGKTEEQATINHYTPAYVNLKKTTTS